MKFKKFLGFIVLLWIFLLFIVVFSVPVKTSAQEVPQPTFVCLGDCPEISANPTSANLNPTEAVPGTANPTTSTTAVTPAATSAPAATGSTSPPTPTPGCQPVTDNVTHAKAKPAGTRHAAIDGGLIQKLIELLQMIVKLIEQIMGMMGILPNTGNNMSNTAPAGGQNVNPAVTLPPCPTNTPVPGQQQNVTQPAQPTVTANATPATASQGANVQPVGGANVVHSAQCDGAEPPAGAREAGLTKLAFCEDFSDPSRIDFDNKPVAGKTTFVGMRPGNIFSAKVESSSDFTFTPQGTLQSRSKADNYQADFISTWPTGGGNHAGYDTGAKPFYTEASVKHNQWSSGGARGFFAFWAMDTCHLYNTGCSQFYEPDFYEFISRMHVNAFHWWSSSMVKVDSSCINTKSGGITPEGKDTQFNIYGARFTNDGTNYYYNDKANITGACSGKAWSKNIPVGPVPGKTGKYPIIIGSGPNQPYEVDFVRVWQAP